jgi:peptide/nickel transport system substrate-binding protein
VATAALFIGMACGVAFADTPADTLVIAKVIDDASA